MFALNDRADVLEMMIAGALQARGFVLPDDLALLCAMDARTQVKPSNRPASPVAWDEDEEDEDDEDFLDDDDDLDLGEDDEEFLGDDDDDEDFDDEEEADDEEA